MTDERTLEDGIYEITAGEEWLVVEKGGQMRCRTSEGYDFHYLLRAYAGREKEVPFRGPLEGDRRILPPSRGLKGAFTGLNSVPGYDGNGNRIPGLVIGKTFYSKGEDGYHSPIFDRIDALLDRTRRFSEELKAKGK